MTSTLLIRAEGPVQGWGGSGSEWDQRLTIERPTKSGVVGLVANALGRSRGDSISDLAQLRFGVRADRPGRLEHDYRTAGGSTFPLDARTRLLNPTLTPDEAGRINYGAPRGARNYGWGRAARETALRPMTLLTDAAFLISLTGDTALLRSINAALDKPARLITLGRRANPPSQRLAYQLLDGDQHSTWGNDVQLLPTASTHEPRFWLEHERGTISYEQPADTTDWGPKRAVRMATSLTTPPAPEGQH